MQLRERTQRDGVDIITNTLYNRGIREDELSVYVDIVDNVDKIRLTDGLSYRGMREGIELVHSHLERGSNIGIIIDGDADGLTSTALMYRFIRNNSECKIKLITSDEKSHGFKDVMNQITDELSLIIVPDAGTNDIAEQNEVISRGIDVVVIDHHDISDNTNLDESNGVIINCQRGDNEDGVNTNFTGVGMVYKFIESYGKVYENTDTVEDYLYLMSIGQISDVSDISDMEVRYYVRKGLRVINNDLVMESIKDSVGPISSMTLGFTIIPKLNSISRIGTIEERRNAVKTLAGVYSRIKTFPYKGQEMTPYEVFNDIMVEKKKKQDYYMQEGLRESLYTLKETEQFVVAVLDSDRIHTSSITGLIANKLMSLHNKSAMVLVRGGDKPLRGSARGNTKKTENFKEDCQRTGLFNYAEGHGNAFGVSIDEKNLNRLINESQKAKTTDIIYNVDKLYTMETMNSMEVNFIGKNLDLFGGNCQAPLLGYRDLIVSKRDLKIYERVVKFEINGLSFVVFNNNELRDRLKLDNADEVKFTLVGESSLNSFRGIISPQVVVSDIEIMR